ncbi:MAG: helix-turn-helix transcriptional regulator [Solirubrobacterales bacterium]|nr:helix-turn-helix transcriptional regulator [Solirubrobacterales bacterium]
MGRAQALRARSILSLASGSIDEATAKAREAVGLSLGVGASIDAGIGRFALADALREEGNDQLAVSELESALAVFAECGASRWQKLAEKKLRALGQKIHRRSGVPAGETGVESLTGREREVAELVVDRRTNREIAEVLFLSQKTVETHLRNIFAKLGVYSRVEVARAIEQQSG